MQLEKFSHGEYYTEVVVEPNLAETPRINKDDYEDIQYELYEAGEHDDRILFKLENVFLPVEPDVNVETNVLSVPGHILDKTTVTNPPCRRSAFVQKPWMAQMITPFL